MEYNDEHIVNEDFAEKYIRLRHWEGRVYTDEEVARLPEIATTHPHYKEWMIRKGSASRFSDYLQKQQRPLRILEVGCGNGWLSALISRIPGCEVTGIDINVDELMQARRVFQQEEGLEFRIATREDLISSNELFDMVLFASSIQYFPSLKETISSSMKLLQNVGEIHLIDSHFYKPTGLAIAKQRSKLYFEAVGFPELSAHYFHHSLAEFETINHEILYDPHRLRNRIMRNHNPFYWIRIKKE